MVQAVKPTSKGKRERKGKREKRKKTSSKPDRPGLRNHITKQPPFFSFFFLPATQSATRLVGVALPSPWLPSYFPSSLPPPNLRLKKPRFFALLVLAKAVLLPWLAWRACPLLGLLMTARGIEGAGAGDDGAKGCHAVTVWGTVLAGSIGRWGTWSDDCRVGKRDPEPGLEAAAASRKAWMCGGMRRLVEKLRKCWGGAVDVALCGWLDMGLGERLGCWWPGGLRSEVLYLKWFC